MHQSQYDNLTQTTVDTINLFGMGFITTAELLTRLAELSQQLPGDFAELDGIYDQMSGMSFPLAASYTPTIS